MGIEVSLD